MAVVTAVTVSPIVPVIVFVMLMAGKGVSVPLSTPVVVMIGPGVGISSGVSVVVRVVLTGRLALAVTVDSCVLGDGEMLEERMTVTAMNTPVQMPHRQPKSKTIIPAMGKTIRFSITYSNDTLYTAPCEQDFLGPQESVGC